MSDIEAAIMELEDVFDFGDWSPECLEAARTVIAAARATHGDINALAIAQAQIIVDNQPAAERQAREQAETRAACEAEGRFQAESALAEAVALLRRLDEAGSGDEYAEIVQLDVRAFLAKHGGAR